MAATDLLWFSGEDALNLPLLAIGATGVVSVVGHVAGEQYAAMVAAVDRGDLAEARRIHTSLIPVVDAIMTTSQGAIMAKAALVELGVIESAAVRLPARRVAHRSTSSCSGRPSRRCPPDEPPAPRARASPVPSPTVACASSRSAGSARSAAT